MVSPQATSHLQTGDGVLTDSLYVQSQDTSSLRYKKRSTGTTKEEDAERIRKKGVGGSETVSPSHHRRKIIFQIFDSNHYRQSVVATSGSNQG